MNREEVFNELMETLYETSRLINSYESIPRKYGTEDELFMVEVHTLGLIGNHRKITTSEIAEITNRTKSAVSQMVEKIIKKDLAVKYRNPNNYRELIIELTPKGQIVYEYHKNLDEVEYGKHLKNLKEYTAEDFQIFTRMTKELNCGVERALNGKDVLEK
ncbi:MarR family transcriptional regulator [Filibacter tadaridae]|uniref:DNA-binding transcriptional repressor MarR n=1 Tax=Filibacter tadaridae TaxID=2483811 RepID=A0A3P5XSF4_9BACL|nr:MarR family transcriptional regulator [Filibacter tadaridae]VDC33732.1 DNA-binding transcriptional repressor MarR [Filibacter tadaridae]